MARKTKPSSKTITTWLARFPSNQTQCGNTNLICIAVVRLLQNPVGKSMTTDMNGQSTDNLGQDSSGGRHGMKVARMCRHDLGILSFLYGRCISHSTTYSQVDCGV